MHPINRMMDTALQENIYDEIMYNVLPEPDESLSRGGKQISSGRAPAPQPVPTLTMAPPSQLGSNKMFESTYSNEHTRPQGVFNELYNH